MIILGKAFEFYMLYEKKDFRGLLRLTCDSILGMAKGEQLFNELVVVLDKYVTVSA